LIRADHRLILGCVLFVRPPNSWPCRGIDDFAEDDLNVRLIIQLGDSNSLETVGGRDKFDLLI
jgi:hypothetical protein